MPGKLNTGTTPPIAAGNCKAAARQFLRLERFVRRAEIDRMGNDLPHTAAGPNRLIIQPIAAGCGIFAGPSLIERGRKAGPRAGERFGPSGRNHRQPKAERQHGLRNMGDSPPAGTGSPTWGAKRSI
jgi:hypothetical protein